MCLLLYTLFGDTLKIYLDLILIINFFFDFILLLFVSILLKRNSKLNRIILSSFFGGLSILFLFFKINSFELFIFKIIISIIMVLIAFGYKNIKYTIFNLLYLYIISIFLGGFLYFINLELSYKHIGLIFINNGFSINILLIILLTPIILYIYYYQSKKLKNNYNNYYKVKIYYNNNIIDCIGYMDTGNNLIDKITHKKVILIDKRKIIFNIDKFRYIPLKTISGNNLIKCIKIDKVVINNKEYHNLLLGIIDNINLDGIDVILNNKMEEI